MRSCCAPARRSRRRTSAARRFGLGRGLAFVGYERDWYGLYARLATEMTDKDQGTLLLVDTLARRRVNERFTVNIGPGIT